MFGPEVTNDLPSSPFSVSYMLLWMFGTGSTWREMASYVVGGKALSGWPLGNTSKNLCVAEQTKNPPFVRIKSVLVFARLASETLWRADDAGE